VAQAVSAKAAASARRLARILRMLADRNRRGSHAAVQSIEPASPFRLVQREDYEFPSTRMPFGMTTMPLSVTWKRFLSCSRS